MIYDRIGTVYSTSRRTEPAWAARIRASLGDAESVVNIGAGSGSYEPEDVCVVAVEPSLAMIEQRSSVAAPVVQAVAEALPFRDQQFGAALAVLTTHHWRNPEAGFMEMRRVSRRQVFVTWDPDWFASRFWLIRDYFPALADKERSLPTLRAVVASFPGAAVAPLPVPADCADGFFGAFWCRPEAYLDPVVSASISGLALLEPGLAQKGLERLRADLDSGLWHRRNADLMGADSADLGYRLITCREAS